MCDFSNSHHHLLGGDNNWKNSPTHIADGTNSLSMLIDINGDGLPDRVFDRNPSNDQQGFYVFLISISLEVPL
jgi:hypothetical protein